MTRRRILVVEGHGFPPVFNRIDLSAELLTADRAAPPRAFARASRTGFDVRAEGDVAEINLYDEIGFFGVTAAVFKRQLDGIKAKIIRLKINSPGGDVFDGIAMHNDLLAHAARVEVHVTGLAASAASVIAMAGDRIVMAPNSFLMIHNAWTIAMGDKSDFEHTAGVLKQIDDALARTYVARSDQKLADIVRMMDEETWMDGPRAVELGFADASDDSGGEEPQAAFDLSGFRNVPSGLKQRLQPGAPATIRDFERALRDAGASEKTAKAVLARGFGHAHRDDDANAEFVAALERLNHSVSGA